LQETALLKVVCVAMFGFVSRNQLSVLLQINLDANAWIRDHARLFIFGIWYMTTAWTHDDSSLFWFIDVPSLGTFPSKQKT